MAESARTVRVTGVSIDSRTVRPGDCFFALAGENFDGHDYVAAALAKGAVCAVVSRPVKGLDATDKLILTVADTIEALGELARAYRRMHPFRVVAITGSVGKTTTRQIVFHVLSRHLRARQARKNFNNTIGLPLTLLDAEPDDEVLVVELGANQPGEIGYLTRLAQPNVAVVTNAHAVHLEGFGDVATVIREKVSIAEGLGEDGVLIVNADIEALLAAGRDTGRPLRTFGRSAQADYRAEHIAWDDPGSRFSLNGERIRLPLPGPGNVENALAAWAVCRQFGLTIDDFRTAVETLPAVAMRAELLHIGSLTVLNDCYNASPASMRNALAMLARLRAAEPARRSRRVVFICGEMAELGPQAEALHAELAGPVVETGVDLFVAVGRRPQMTARRAEEMAPYALRTLDFDGAPSVCDNLQKLIEEDDIILVKGSRTARLERVVEKLGELFATTKAPHRIEEQTATQVQRRPENIKDRETG